LNVLLNRRGVVHEPDTAQQMRHWHHRGGFSVDASVRLEALYLVLAILKQRYRWDRSLSKRLHFLEINLFEQKTLLSLFAANPCGAPHVEDNEKFGT
jgi:hypothetical protein